MERKSTYKFFITLIIVIGMFISSMLVISSFTEQNNGKVVGNSDVIKEFNKNNSGDPTILEDGYVFNIPDEVQNELWKKAKIVENKDFMLNTGFSSIPDSGDNQDGNSKEMKYSEEFSLEQIFYANLKPRNLNDYLGAMFIFDKKTDSSSDYEEMYRIFCVNYLSMSDEINSIDRLALISNIKNNQIDERYFELIDMYINSEPTYYDLIHNNLMYFGSDTFYYSLQYQDRKYANDMNNYIFGPSQYNDANIVDKSMVAFIPTKISKINDNNYLIDISVDGPITNEYLSALKYHIGRLWKQKNRGDYDINKNHLFMKIIDVRIEDDKFGGYGIYCLDTIDGYGKSFDIFSWYPNNEGIQLINEYFRIVNEQVSINENIDPEKILKTIANNNNLNYYDVANCVLSYIYMFIY